MQWNPSKKTQAMNGRCPVTHNTHVLDLMLSQLLSCLECHFLTAILWLGIFRRSHACRTVVQECRPQSNSPVCVSNLLNGQWIMVERSGQVVYAKTNYRKQQQQTRCCFTWNRARQRQKVNILFYKRSKQAKSFRITKLNNKNF